MDWIKNTYNAAALKVDGLQGSEMEKQVKEATSNANWGVTSTLKNSIADGTNDYQQFREVMGVLWKRMGDKAGTNWRVVYKSLDLLMHIIKFGHDRVIEDVRDHQIVLRPLQDFHYFDPETGNDRGRGIRTLTKQIFDLLKDTQQLNKLRDDARKQRQKLSGINKTYMSGGGGDTWNNQSGGSGGGGGGGGSGGYNSNYSGNQYKSRSYEDEANQWSKSYGSSYDPYKDKSKNTWDDKDKKKKKKKKKMKKKKHESDE
eukprot:963456_1